MVYILEYSCLGITVTNLIVAHWKFDVLKTSIFALEASLLGQIFVLRTPLEAIRFKF